MTRTFPVLLAVLLCVSCVKGTPTNPIFPPGVSPTALPQPSYVGIGRYEKLAERTSMLQFGGVAFVTFVEVRQAKGTTISHRDEPGFVYALQGPHSLSRDDGERVSSFGEGGAAWVSAGTDHVNPTGNEEIWYFVSVRSVLQRSAPPPYPAYKILVSSPDIEGVPADKPIVHQLGLITMEPGGRTSSHSHGGTETFYVMKGTIELALNNGTRTKFGAGQGTSVKPGVVMQMRVVGPEPVRILTYFVTPEGEPWQDNLQTLP